MAKKNANGQGGKKPTKVVGLDQLGAVISEFKPDIEQGSDSTILGAAKQFGRDLENQIIEYKRAEKAINKRRVTKELALESLAIVEGRVDALEQDFLTWKQVHAPDVTAISSDDKAAIDAVEEKIFAVKVRHQCMLEAANAMIDLAVEPNETEPQVNRRPDAGSAEMSDEEVDRRIRNIVYARNAWNPELDGPENQRKRWEVVERYTREMGDAIGFDLSPYFLNAGMEKDFRLAMDELAGAYRDILDKKDEARQAERAKRDAARLAEVKNPLGYLGGAKFWKEDVTGRDRNEIIRRLVSGDVPDDELVGLVAGGPDDVARLRRQIGDFRDRIVEQFAVQRKERKAPAETREARLPSIQEMAQDHSLWKLEVPYEQRMRIIVDCGLGRVSAEELMAFIPDVAAGEKIFEAAFRFKQEEMDSAREFLDSASGRIQKIIAEYERLLALSDDAFSHEDSSGVVDAMFRLKRSIQTARERLVELGEASVDLEKYNELRVLGEKAEEKLRQLRNRVKDPFEVRTNAVVENADLWNEGVPDDERKGLFIAAVDRVVRSDDEIIGRTVKNIDVFAEEVKAMRKHLVDRGLLEAEAAVPDLPKAEWKALPDEAKKERRRADIAAQQEKILTADYWTKGVDRAEREALIAPESIPTHEEIAKLDEKIHPMWARTAQTALARLVQLRRSLAALESRASRAPSVASVSEVAPVVSSEPVVEAGPTEREKAIREHYDEIKKMLAHDAFWNPSFGGSSNRGVRGAVIARVLKGQAGPKPENLRDPELFARISAFTSFDDVTAQYNAAVRAYDAELARASVAPAAPVEARETPPAAAPEVPPLIVRPPRAVEAAPVAVPPRRMSPAARPPEAPRSPEAPPAASPTPRVEARPTPAMRPAPERPRLAPSTSAERYFERARASRFRLEDDDVEQPNEPPMRAQEKTSSLAKRATSWLRGLFGRAESEPNAESSTVGPQAQAATGAIAAGGRIFGYSAFRGVTDRIAGISSAERKVIDGALSRAAAGEREARSAEATLEQRHMTNIETVERIERSVNAASMPESSKAELRAKLAEIRGAYEAEVAASGERRDARVAAEIESSAQGSQPSLRARGANFLRERGFMALAEAIGPEGSGRDAGLVARVVAAFRGGFRDVWSRVSPATVPTSDAVRTLGDRVGVESRIAAVEAAALAGSVGGTEMSAEAQRRLQQNIDDLLAALKRGDR